MPSNPKHPFRSCPFLPVGANREAACVAPPAVPPQSGRGRLRRRAAALAGIAGAFALSPAAAAASPTPGAKYALQAGGEPVVPRLIAADVCAWPAMTKLPDGTLLIANYNRPSHGRMIGDVDCWASTDHGRTWQQRATAAPHEPGTPSNRMNVAFGTLPNGDALLATGGWSLKPDSVRPEGLEIDQVLPVWLCRSRDGARSWQIDRDSFPAYAPDGGRQFPFGPIQAGRDGLVLLPVYTVVRGPNGEKASWNRVYIYRSTDHGRTWLEPVAFDSGTRLNETALLHVEGARWLAFARQNQLLQYESLDDGRTWRQLGAVTERYGYPANAIQLQDGRLLLCYGNRTPGDPRVEAKISLDRGRTWSEPIRLVEPNKSKDALEDFGYPSSIELPDGNVITAYYAKDAPYHRGYHLAAVTWNPARSFGRDLRFAPPAAVPAPRRK